MRRLLSATFSLLPAFLVAGAGACASGSAPSQAASSPHNASSAATMRVAEQASYEERSAPSHADTTATPEAAPAGAAYGGYPPASSPPAPSPVRATPGGYAPPAPPPVVPRVAVTETHVRPAATATARALEPGPAPLMLPQHGASIRAGEWDDNANYREFQRWLQVEDRVGFHRVDVRDRRFLVVRDAGGKAVPRCRVVVTDEGQRQVSLTTVASGRAILFPHAEGLQGKSLAAFASCAGSSASARFSLDDQDGLVDLRLTTARALPQSRAIDVAFILDTTGSMAEEITAVKATIHRVAAQLNQGDVRVRIGMVAFKDRGDEYVTKVFPMTTDVAAFQREISSVSASGGGDTPESVSEGVHVAMSRLDWGGDAVAKMAFLVGDAPPHLDYPQDFDYVNDMKDAAHRGIQLFTIAASGMDDLGQVVWRQLAQYTNASNLFVLRGGAGPQSTGAGDPRSSCGGTHENYASGNLDGLILAKIHHELKAIDRDPLRIPGLRVDENAKPCNERLVATD